MSLVILKWWNKTKQNKTKSYEKQNKNVSFLTSWLVCLFVCLSVFFLSFLIENKKMKKPVNKSIIFIIDSKFYHSFFSEHKNEKRFWGKFFFFFFLLKRWDAIRIFIFHHHQHSFIFNDPFVENRNCQETGSFVLYKKMLMMMIKHKQRENEEINNNNNNNDK